MKSTARINLAAVMCTMALCLITACQTLGVPSPKTFNERLASGYVTVTTIRQIGTTLVQGGQMSSSDAANVQEQADNARAGLDIARTMTGVTAEDKLTSTLVILNGLLTYVNSKGAK